MADTEDYSSLPIEQRLTHKVWKVRMGAYSSLTSELKTLDPDQDGARFNMVEQYLTKMILDTNMAAQEAGVATAIAFVENAPNPLRYRSEIVAGVVSKCIASTKANTRTQSVELLMLLSEADTPGPVVEGVLEGFDAKMPKAVVAAVSAVRELVGAFGVKFINLKSVVKALSKPFGHRDNSVRSEAQALAVELYRWIGKALVPSLQDLQPVLLKELEAQFEKIAGEPKPKQTRLLRSQQEVEESPHEESAGGAGAEEGGDNDGEVGDVDGEMDAWEIADPVDITKKLPDDFHAMVASKKWKERKEVIEALHATLEKSVRLQPNSATGDLIQDLGKKITDTNIVVATIVIQCLGQFAATMRTAFAPYAQSTLPGLVEKSKERKQTVIDAIRVTMDNYFLAVNRDLTAIGDHYFTGAAHKNPQVRAEATHFLRRCFSEVSTRPGKADVKRYSEQLKTGLDDGDANVREAAAECMGTLGKLVTTKVLEPFIEGIDKIKMEKVTDYMGKATVKAKAPKPAAKPPPPSSAAARSGARSGAPRPGARAAPGARPASIAKPAPVEEEKPVGLGANMPPHLRKKLEASARAAAIKKAQREGRPLDDLPPEPAPAPTPKAAAAAAAAAPARAVRPAAAPAVKRPLNPRPAAAAKPGASAAPAGGSKGADETVRMRFANDDSLDDKIADALPTEALTGLESAKWKERVEAMDALKQHLEGQAAADSPVHPELVIRQFSKKPGWKESNFQVTSRVFQVIEWMASERSVDFTTGAAALSIPHLVDKLGDIKLKGPAGNALVAIAERFTLKFLLGQAIEPIKSQKSPKVLADCLLWVDSLLLEFGIKGLALRPIVNMVRESGLMSSNAQTRAKAVTVMGTLRRAVGPAVKDFVEDLNPQLMQLLDAEFDKVADEPMPEPTRTQEGHAGAANGSRAAAGSGGADDAGAGDDPIDDLFPRQDITTLLPNTVYKMLSDADWKKRKEGLTAIQSALDSANHRIQPNIPSDIYTALKLRLQDANKNLIAVALGLLGALSTDSGAAQTPSIRIVALPTMQCMADKKPQVRSAAVAAMTAWAIATPACVDQAVLPAVHLALAETSPELRATLLQWIADTLSPRKGHLPDLSHLSESLFACLQDRNADVRKQAKRVLALMVDSCGFEAVHDMCNMQLKNVAKGTVMPMIEELRHSAIGGSEPKRPASTAAATAPASSRRGIERAVSPAAEPVMTASELIGRASGVGHAATAPASPVPASSPAVGGPGMLRRPMAVKRPAGVSSSVSLASMRQKAIRGASSGPNSRPGSSLRAVTPSQGQSMAHMSNEELESVPPVLGSDIRSKEQRARKDMAMSGHGTPRWAQLGEARNRGDLEAQLKLEMAHHFNPLVHRLLFSTGHYKDRDYLNGLTILDEVLAIASLSQERYGLPLVSTEGSDSLAARFTANIDLVLKYISIRMYDGSTHTLLKSFDLLEQLIGLAEQSESTWSDYEASAILPALISRLGDSKEVVRTRARRLLCQQVAHLYPTTKLFASLLDYGVTNRANSRIRQESLDAVCYLIRERTAGLGLSAVCTQPSRVVPVFAQGIADRDSNVRTSSLNVLVAVGEQLPGGADDLWRMCGRLAEKERTMLEEKLKRSTIGVGSAASAATATTAVVNSNGDGMARPISRLSQAAAAAGGAGGRSRMSMFGAPISGIGRPTSGGRSVTSGINRLARPAQPSGTAPPLSAPGRTGESAAPFPEPVALPPPPAPAASSGRPSFSTRPVFSLDFDSLNLPQYSAATTECQVGLASSRSKIATRVSEGARAIAAGPNESAERAMSPQFRSPAQRSSYYEPEDRNPPTSLPGSRIGVGVRGSDSAQSGVGRPMSFAGYGLGMPQYRRQADFAAMSEPEREQWIEGIIADLSGDDPKATEMAIERLQAILDSLDYQPTSISGQSSPGVTHIRRNISNIVSGLAMQVRWSYTTMTTDPSISSPFQTTLHRIRKLTNNVLLELFSDPRLALAVPQGTLNTLLEELIRRIVDPALKAGDPGMSHFRDRDQLFKGLNALIVKILDRADRTGVFVSLIQLMTSSLSERVPNPPPPGVDMDRQNFGDMTMKCLWRLSKSLPTEAKSQFARYSDTTMTLKVGRPAFGDPRRHPSLRVEQVIRAAHRHLVVIPEEEWYKREDKNKWLHGDMPKRTVKTIIHSLVNILRRNIWMFTGLLIKDVMDDNPGMILMPPYSGSDDDPRLISYVEETSTQLAQLSDIWMSMSNILRSMESGFELPTVTQLATAMEVADIALYADDDDDDELKMEVDFDDDQTVYSSDPNISSGQLGNASGASIGRPALQDSARDFPQLATSSAAAAGSVGASAGAASNNGAVASRIAVQRNSRIGSPMRSRPASMMDVGQFARGRGSPVLERLGQGSGQASARQQSSLTRPTGNTDMEAIRARLANMRQSIHPK